VIDIARSAVRDVVKVSELPHDAKVGQDRVSGRKRIAEYVVFGSIIAEQIHTLDKIVVNRSPETNTEL
jgi:hypothetical protein